MALPSRMGAFMVGAAFGSVQCFYWLREDVKHVGDAMDRKIEAISEEVRFTCYLTQSTILFEFSIRSRNAINSNIFSLTHL